MQHLLLVINLIQSTKQTSGKYFIQVAYRPYIVAKPRKLTGRRHSEILILHLHSRLNTWLQWIGQGQLQDETRHIFLFAVAYIRGFAVLPYNTATQRSLQAICIPLSA